MTPIPLTAVLTTKRTRLRVPSEADIPHIWSATRHPGFNDGLLWDAPTSLEELDIPFRRGLERWVDGDAYGWTIETLDDRSFVGQVAVTRTDRPGEWSLGFWIHPSWQGHGYAREAARALVEFAFGQLDARKIVAAHATWNRASARVLESIGMSKVRTNPRGFLKNGKWVEEYEYELTGPPGTR